MDTDFDWITSEQWLAAGKCTVQQGDAYGTPLINTVHTPPE